MSCKRSPSWEHCTCLEGFCPSIKYPSSTLGPRNGHGSKRVQEAIYSTWNNSNNNNDNNDNNNNNNNNNNNDDNNNNKNNGSVYKLRRTVLHPLNFKTVITTIIQVCVF